MPLPTAGQVLLLTERASVQFRVNPIVFRVIRVQERAAPDGWIWVDGYELDLAGEAVLRRELMILLASVLPPERAARAVERFRRARLRRRRTLDEADNRQPNR